jgi:hypothetical protein
MVTLSVDGDQLAELTSVVGVADVDAAVDAAISAYVTKLQGLNEAGEWIAELVDFGSRRGQMPRDGEALSG